MQLNDLAAQFGGGEIDGAVRVPAENLTKFLQEAEKHELDVGFVECLFIGPGLTRPSMLLSEEVKDHPSRTAFHMAAKEAAEKAIVEAKLKGLTAVFEVW
jgi:hypothetical protein